MKKSLAILAIAAFTFCVAPITTYAAGSPIAETKAQTPNNSGETQDSNLNGDDEHNKDSKSPKTGSDVAVACVSLIGAAGISLFAKKKVTED